MRFLVLAEHGLVTVGWSGQSDTAPRREIAAAAGRRYGYFLGICGEPILDVATRAAEGEATILPATWAAGR